MELFGKSLIPFVRGLILVIVLSTFEMDEVDSWIFKGNFWLMNSVDEDNSFVVNPENSKIKILCWSVCQLHGVTLVFLNRFWIWKLEVLLTWKIGSFAGSTMGSDMLFFSRVFFWTWGLLEYWIRSYGMFGELALAVLFGLGRSY